MSLNSLTISGRIHQKSVTATGKELSQVQGKRLFIFFTFLVLFEFLPYALLPKKKNIFFQLYYKKAYKILNTTYIPHVGFSLKIIKIIKILGHLLKKTKYIYIQNSKTYALHYYLVNDLRFWMLAGDEPLSLIKINLRPKILWVLPLNTVCYATECRK